MKIRVRRRLPKIRNVISASLRFRSLIRRLVWSRGLPDRIPQKYFLCCQRSSVVGSPLVARSHDLAGLHHCRRRSLVPEGSVAVYVGEERQRFVIPILYLSHPFITRLLAEVAEKEADAEGEFSCNRGNRGGPLTVPCDVSDFEQVKWLIDRETNAV